MAPVSTPVDVPVALLGYGTVGSAVERLLRESADDIERATGHRLRVVRALVRDPAKERPAPAGPGLLTDDFAAIRDDPLRMLRAGGCRPAGMQDIRGSAAGRQSVAADSSAERVSMGLPQ